MPIRVKVGEQTVQFPDGTSQEEMAAALEKLANPAQPWSKEYPKIAAGARALLDSLPGLGALAGGIVATPETFGTGSIAGAALGAGVGRGLRDLASEGLGLESVSSPTSKAARIALDTGVTAVTPGVIEAARTPVQTAREAAPAVMAYARRVPALRALLPETVPAAAAAQGPVLTRPAWQTWPQYQASEAAHLDISTPARPSQMTPQQLAERMTQGTGTPPAPASPKPPITTPAPTATAEAPPSQAAEGTPKAASIDVGTGSGQKLKLFSWEVPEYIRLTTKAGKSAAEAQKLIEGQRAMTQRMGLPATTAEPASATLPGTTPAPTAPAAPPSTPAPVPRSGEPVGDFVKGMMDLGYSPSEATQAYRWVRDKVPFDQILQRLQAARKLQAANPAIGALPSNMEVGRAVIERNQSGRWRP